MAAGNASSAWLPAIRMKRLKMRGVVFVFAVQFCLTASADDHWLILENLMLVDGSGAPPRIVDELIARNGEIVFVNSTGGSFEFTPNEFDIIERVDLDGAWVIPGLIDTHTHAARFPDSYGEGRRILSAALRGGVTTVRDLGGDARSLAELERARRARQFEGPEIVFSAMVGNRALFDDERIAVFSTGYAPGDAPWAMAVDAKSDLPRLIARSSGSGVSALKLYAGLDRADVLAIGEEARRQGLALWAHATVFPAGPFDLIDAGVSSLSHAPYLVWAAITDIPDDYGMRTKGRWPSIAPDHPRLLELYDEMARRGVYLDATLFVFRRMHNFAPTVVADWAGPAADWAAAATSLAHQRGVRVTTGTDWFEPSEADGLPNTHAELELLVEEAGFTPLAALVAATRNGAEALGLGLTHGLITEGRQADLVVLNANPLADISNTRDIKMVFKSGRRVINR